VQKPHPPIVFGGETDAALRRAAALGDGWYGIGHSPQSASPQIEKLRALLAGAGRTGAPFEITVSTGLGYRPGRTCSAMPTPGSTEL